MNISLSLLCSVNRQTAQQLELELSRNICILQEPFHCCAGLSHPDECMFLTLWYTVIDV